jgi:DNA gyrase/topoisomerase IV subunit B
MGFTMVTGGNDTTTGLLGGAAELLTRHPEQRSLLKVMVHDAVDAEVIFSTLMGDQVEPRREFIEANALKVKYLDI